MPEHRVNTQFDNAKDDGVLVFAVRKDSSAYKRIVQADADGAFIPLTTNEYGEVRALLSARSEVSAPSMEQKMDEMLSLLRRLVAAAELMNETEIPDQQGDALRS